MKIERSALVEYSFPFADRSLSICAYASLDALLDQAEHEDEIPFWAELWPSSVALASWLSPQNLAGRRVLELGCGVGLAGIAAALCGSCVLQTDYVPAALVMARYNAWRNRCLGMRWRLADWRAFPTFGRFDMIIGADILYEQRLHADLQAVLNRHLQPNGVAVIADPGRLAAESFVRGLERNRWRWRLEELTIEAVKGGTESINLLMFSRTLPEQ